MVSKEFNLSDFGYDEIKGNEADIKFKEKRYPHSKVKEFIKRLKKRLEQIYREKPDEVDLFGEIDKLAGNKLT